MEDGRDYRSKKVVTRIILLAEVDEEDGEDHEDGDDKEEELAHLLDFLAEDDGIEAPFLEARGTVLAMTVVVMVVML